MSVEYLRRPRQRVLTASVVTESKKPGGGGGGRKVPPASSGPTAAGTSRASSRLAYGTPAATPVPKPTGLTVGDVMFASVMCQTSTVPAAPDGSWTALHGPYVLPGGSASTHAYTWFKVATADDVAAASFAFSRPVTNMVHTLTALSGMNQVSPIDVSGSYTATPANLAHLIAPSVTPVQNYDYLLTMHFGQKTSGSSTPGVPTGMTSLVASAAELWAVMHAGLALGGSSAGVATGDKTSVADSTQARLGGLSYLVKGA